MSSIRFALASPIPFGKVCTAHAPEPRGDMFAPSDTLARRAAFALPLIVYAIAAFPDVGFWDTGEMAVVSWIYGIAHPPGFPLYVAAGWLWTHLFDVGDVAWRLAIFSAVCTAGACRLLYAIARRYASISGALAATGLFAFAEVALTRGTRAEIHTAALFFCALCLHAAERARRGEARAFALLPVWAALGICTHPVVVWALPGAGLLAVSRFARCGVAERLRYLRRFEYGAAAAAACFVALYALIPLRSAFVAKARLDPTLGLGFAPGMPFWDYAHPATIANFLWFVQGKQFAPQGSLWAWSRLAEYPHYAETLLAFFLRQFPAPLVVVVGAAIVGGLIALLRREPIAGCAYSLAAFAGVPFAAAYAIEIDGERYLLFCLFVCAILAAIGADAAAAFLARRVPRVSARAATGVATGALALCALGELGANRAVFAQRHNYEGRALIRRVVAATPPDAVIVAEWTYATPLAYAAYVERAFGRRVVVTAEARDVAARFPALARAHPLYLVDGDITGFRDPRVVVRAVDEEFPRVVRIEARRDGP